MAYESQRMVTKMERQAELYWFSQWEVELQKKDAAEKHDKNTALSSVDENGPLDPLTDAQRSALREAARPAKGCKCGSLSHEYVNHP
eukprot:CAMPEP_0201933230 /NCGR_PEP_ID=MMETSP0903-20130614/31101_1 /ASSEMBLY_ACC=CAM_ASM_000552 /TAXON_ID=420261 /ORGANISM="Thalassiosira antarctica, Strain CCMP982" /LENGTH=86 /DNA_ID=CAMNT_0048473091 /DNA_START=5 /DNA_END=261 /DNA_ORIENTATION=-